jgi:ABC transporter substrate binding protein
MSAAIGGRPVDICSLRVFRIVTPSSHRPADFAAMQILKLSEDVLGCEPSSRASRMRRRNFIAGLVSTTAAWPFATRAQQGEPMRRIGFLSPIAENDPDNQNWIKGLTQRLEELGWTNGRNVRIDFRFAGADSSRMPRLATELLESRPEVLVAATIGPATALRQQTLSIPIVFVLIPDPVAAGFVTNLAHPEGNITGFTNFEFSIGGSGCSS